MRAITDVGNLRTRSATEPMAVAALVATVLASAQVHARGEEHHAITLSAIREAVLQLHDAVDSLDVRYCMTDQSSDPSARVSRHRHRFAAKGRLRYRENTHFDERYPVALDLNHTHQYFTGETFDLFSQHQRVYEVSHEAAKQHYPWKVRADTFIDVAGWWPAEDEPSTGDTSDVAVHLRVVLMHPKYTLRTGTQSIDGHACYVVENPGLDRLWLDRSVGFAPRKRERYDPDSGCALYRYRCADFKEFNLSRGPRPVAIWFPMRATLESLRLDDGRTSEMLVEDLKLGQVEDEIFRFSPPAGTLILDRDTNESCQVPGGRDLLDESIALAQMLQAIEPNAAVSASRRQITLDTFLLAGIIACLVGFNAFLFTVS